MLAYLESAAEDQREMVQQVLEYITDLSSDENSPTLNAGGHRHAVNSGLSSGVATAFVHGVAATQLCGCDSNGPKGNWGEGVSSSRSPYFQPNDLAVRSVAADPGVHEEPPIEGFLLLTLRRVNGRLERAQRSGNNGKIVRFLQSRTWLLSCISHLPESSIAEKLRIREVINETNDMNEDEDSPHHGLGEPEKLAAVMMAHKAFGCFVGLLEYDGHEEIAVLLGQLGAAMRACLQRPALRRSAEGSALRRLWPNGGVRSRLLGLGPLRTWKR